MANKPASSAAHWCQGVLEEANLHDPLSAPSYQYHHQQQQQQQQQSQLHCGQYSNQPYSYSTGGSTTPSSAPQMTPQEYYQQYYEQYRRNQQQSSISTPSSHYSTTSAASSTATTTAQQEYYRKYYEQYRRNNQQAQATNFSDSSPTHIQSHAQQSNGHNSSYSYANAVKQNLVPSYSAVAVQRPAVQAPVPPPAVVAQAASTVKKAPVTQPTVSTSSGTSAADTQTKNAKANNHFPPSLKAYVERAFASCKTDEDRKMIENHLKDIIGRVSTDGRLHKHRWDLETIPCLPSFSQVMQSPVSSLAQQAVECSTNDNIPRKRKSRFSLDTNRSSNFNEIPSDTLLGKYGPGSDIVDDDKADQARKRRASRFSTQQSTNEALNGLSKKRKKGQYQYSTPVLQNPSPPTVLTQEDIENMKVVGTCQTLEKDYFRLTSAPDPNTVRPEAVLRRALKFVLEKWENEKNRNKEINSYVLSQFKSLRQDLTLQHIKNDLTVQVYETHARIALEIGDLNEYNQCQTQLKQLYASGLKGSEMEFTAYRVLYYLYLQGNKKYQNGSQDMLHLMSSLPNSALSHSSVQHAFSIRKALLQENYHRFFDLFKHTPGLGNCILGLMITGYRYKVLQRMFKAYKPGIEEEFVLNELAFDTTEEGRDFLALSGCVYDTTSKSRMLDTKTSILVPPKDDSGLLL